MRVGVPDFLLFNCVSGVAGDFCFLEVKKFRDGLRFEQFEWFRNFHDWKALATAAASAVLGPLMRALNPNDHAFGIKSPNSQN